MPDAPASSSSSASGGVRVHRIGAVTVLAPAGALAGDAAGAFARTLSEQADRSLGRLVVDLSAVPTLDSLALETLVDAAHRLEDGGVALRLCGLSGTLNTVLEITGHADAFELFPGPEEAARSFL